MSEPQNELKTPDYDLKQLVDVYEPSEDTFLFIDALETELSFIRSRNVSNVNFILEIGSGSGLITTALGASLPSSCCFTTDINMKACKATKSTGDLNNVHVEAVCMDLASHFCRFKFDILIFNPPYVVTEPGEIQGTGLNRAWAGGINGRQVIDQLLPHVATILNDNGVLYLLLLKENKPEEVVKCLEQMGFRHKIIKERKILGEYLYIIRFIKSR